MTPPRRQATLTADVALSGRSLHTGQPCAVRISPAPAGHGVVFRRRIGDRTLDVAADWRQRVSMPLCTALQLPDGHRVRTVEHLLAALSALRIDAALVEIDKEELPIFDGSAKPWCEALSAAGRTELGEPVRFIRVLKTVDYQKERHRIRIEPADALTLDVSIALAHFPPMRWSGAVTPESFVGELSPARSFGRIKWALPAKIYGTFARPLVLRGATWKNTAAIWGGRVIGGMTIEDEPVRHRALDIVGDLALAGSPILGAVTAQHPGHEHTYGLLSRLMQDERAWTYAEASPTR